MKLVLFFCILSICSFAKTSEFLYDSENDIVYFNNKKYVQLEKYKHQDQTRALSLSEEEPQYLTLQDGSSFYYYIFCIICKSNRLI